MQQSKTAVAIILDSSGSMTAKKNDVIGGFNTFLEEQKKLEGEMTLSLHRFSDDYTTVHDRVPLTTFPLLTSENYITSGSTALLDAVGKTIDDLGQKLSTLPELERPDRVLVVIITDGEENASKEYAAQRVREMVKHQEEAYAWKFIYIGAGVDSFAEGSRIAISSTSAINSSNLRESFSSANAYAMNYRSAPTTSAANSLRFDESVDSSGNAVEVDWSNR